MDKNTEMGSKLVRLGAADLRAGNVDEAVRQYKRALLLARRLIDDTIITFDGDVCPLHLYTTTCHGLVALYVRTGHSAAARLCLEETGRTFVFVRVKKSGLSVTHAGQGDPGV